jgi:hypothetical protein
MPTNLALNDKLIEEAQSLGGHKSRKETVNAALAEYVQHRRRMKIINVFGTFDFDPNYDYKKERQARKA